MLAKLKRCLGLKHIALACVLSVFFWNSFIEAQAADKAVIGWVEKVGVTEQGFTVHAKIDTGADNSSLNARGITLINEDGRQWVSFQVINRTGDTLGLKRPVVKRVRIKRKGSEGTGRYVINLGVCIGNVFKMVNVNLVDRSNFDYQMLIGRSYLKDKFIVDSSLTYTLQPTCNGEKH